MRKPVWVKPKLVAEVDFHGWTHGDRVRQASFQGLREDKPAKHVVREVKALAANAQAAVKRSAAKGSATRKREEPWSSGVTLSHPDRVYWEDAGVTKRDLAEFYDSNLEMDAPARRRPADRAGALSRRRRRAMFLPEARHHAGIATEHLHLVPEKGDKIISIDDLAGLIALVQAGVLEIHTRGTTIDDREHGDRLVFDLDPGPGTGWKDVVAAARDVRERLARVKLKSFLKTIRRQRPARRGADQAGRRGTHQDILPHRGREPWRQDAPDRYVATATKSKRDKQDFHRLSAQQPRGDRGRALFHPRAAGRAGVDADRLVGARQPQGRQPIHRAQSAGAAQTAAQGSVGRHRQE